MRQLQISDLVDISREHKNAAEGVQRAITLLEEIMFDPNAWRKRDKISVEHYWLRRDLPYVFHKTEIKGTRILLNRNYKPIGSNQPTGGQWARYEDFQNSHVSLSDEQIQSLVEDGRTALFSDGSVPWKGKKEAGNYVARLRMLLRYLVA
ncbi:MAG: hypothetical protein KF834_04790 [Burkholderiales bacterium]|nr:hypothetical protein [Burkholderiales bacterium]